VFIVGAFILVQPVEHQVVANWPRVSHLLDQVQDIGSLLSSASMVPWDSLARLEQHSAHLEQQLTALLDLARNFTQLLPPPRP